MKEADHVGLVSVILPVFNSEHFLESSVLSVLNQTFKDLELVIVNDASEDKTADICSALSEKDCRIRVITNLQNTGTLESRFKAIESAKGEWIAFIDADDLWHPEKLEKQVKIINQKNCDLVYTASAFIDINNNTYKWIMHVPTEVGYKKLLKRNVISNSSVLMRKQDFLKYSPVEERDNDMHEDFACWLCMLRAGLTVHGIDEPLITYRLSGKSSSGNKFKAAKLNMNTYKYIGLNVFERCFYEICYAINGMIKYSHFR